MIKGEGSTSKKVGSCLEIASMVKSMFQRKGGDNEEGTAHLCLTLVVKKLKINVEHGRLVIIFNINKH